MAARMKLFKNSHGFGQLVSTSLSGGVVEGVPTAKYCSISSSVRLRQTSENMAAGLNPSIFSKPATSLMRPPMLLKKEEISSPPPPVSACHSEQDRKSGV